MLILLESAKDRRWRIMRSPGTDFVVDLQFLRLLLVTESILRILQVAEVIEILLHLSCCLHFFV
jgi:hypothetical protein